VSSITDTSIFILLWCVVVQGLKACIQEESYIIARILGTHMYSRREIFVGRLTNQFIFLLQEYLYIGEMVGVVVPAPTSHLLG
jgi:hypothetical protein